MRIDGNRSNRFSVMAGTSSRDMVLVQELDLGAESAH